MKLTEFFFRHKQTSISVKRTPANGGCFWKTMVIASFAYDHMMRSLTISGTGIYMRRKALLRQ